MLGPNEMEPSAGYTHTHRFRVIYGDTDMMGVVYYANYLRYFEAGRNELMRAAGLEYREFETLGYGLPVAQCAVKYVRPARYDDLLTLETTVAKLGYSAIDIVYRLHREADDTLIATGSTTHACVSQAGQVVRMPEVLKTRLSAPGGGSAR